MTSKDQPTAFCRQLLAAAGLALTLVAGAVNADDVAYMIQYEITFNQAKKAKPAGNLYFGFQPRSNDDWGDHSMNLVQGAPLTGWQQGRMPILRVDEKTGEKKITAGAVLLGLVVIGATVWSMSQQEPECIAGTIITQGYGGC